jgi:hypothetical protein
MHKTLSAARLLIVASAMLSLGLAAPAATRPAPAAEHAAAPVARAFLFVPHADSVTGRSARLVWVSDPGVEPGAVTLTGGGATTRVTAEAKPADDRRELLHVAALDGLQPGVRYSYEIACGGATMAGAFRTPPQGAGPFRFVIYGDTRSLPERHAAVAGAIAKEDPDLVLHTGDLVADGDDWDLWKKEFFDPAAPFLRECAFWPVRGNHEETAALYHDLFVLPNSGLHYSFDWGNAHFVVLDVYQAGKDRQAMLEWFRKDLAQNKAEWTFVVYHEPSFNVGGHGSAWGREDFLPVMYDYGVDFAVAGHSHLYERFLPIAQPGRKPIIFIVSGGGGAPSYPVAPSPILAGGIGASVTHYCAFEMDGNRLKMTAKLPDGSVIDRLELVKTDNAYQPEVMAQTLDYVEATGIEFLFAEAKVELPALPAPGEAVDAVLTMPALPADTVLTVGKAAQKGEWTLAPQQAEHVEGGYRFRVTAPQTAVKGDMAGFQPPLRVRLAVKGKGLDAAADNVPLAPGPRTVKLLYPEPAAAPVHRAPRPITVDGDLSDWEGVTPLPNPFHKEPTGPFRFCWTEAGLYGAVDVADKSVAVKPDAPWEADGVEVFVDKAFERATSTGPNTGQYAFCPAPDLGPGKAHFVIASDAGKGKPTRIACAWRPTPTGYALEFFLPAELLAPAHMRVGATIGLNVALDDDGRPVRQFYCDKGNDGWRTPIMWGAIRLAE